jgi:hypothetical protein
MLVVEVEDLDLDLDLDLDACCLFLLLDVMRLWLCVVWWRVSGV